MILNNIEKDIKMKCLENYTTQMGLAKKIGKIVSIYTVL